MGDYLKDTLLPVLEQEDRVDAVAAGAGDLVLGLDGEVLCLTQDSEFGRMVCWGDARKLQPGEFSGGVAAARRYNGSLQSTSGLTMGFYLKGNALVLGKSFDTPEMSPEDAVNAALGVRDGLGVARGLLDTVLEEMRQKGAGTTD